MLRVIDPRSQRTAYEHLPFAQKNGTQKGDEGDPEMRENQFFSVQHN